MTINKENILKKIENYIEILDKTNKFVHIIFNYN